MKKIIYISIILFSTSSLFMSCEDEDKINPIQTIENSAVVAFRIVNEDINIGATDTRVFSADVDRQERVQSYSLDVTRTAGGNTTGPINFGSWAASDFPFILTIDTATLANTFGINAADIQENDRFNFLGTSVDDRGTVYTIENFTGGITGTPELQFNSDGYDFEISIINE